MWTRRPVRADASAMRFAAVRACTIARPPGRIARRRSRSRRPPRRHRPARSAPSAGSGVRMKRRSISSRASGTARPGSAPTARRPADCGRAAPPRSRRARRHRARRAPPPSPRSVVGQPLRARVVHHHAPAPPSALRASDTAVARYGSTDGQSARQCSQISSGLPAAPNELERVGARMIVRVGERRQRQHGSTAPAARPRPMRYARRRCGSSARGRPAGVGGRRARGRSRSIAHLQSRDSEFVSLAAWQHRVSALVRAAGTRG